MSVQVKICGLKHADALTAAIAHGADYVGFVFFEPSPRNVDISVARDLAAMAKGRVKTVALMVDPDDALVERVVSAVEPDFVQLHGNETLERCGQVKERWGSGIIKAVKVETRSDVEAGLVYRDGVDLVLFDAKAPKGFKGALPGGNGLCFDWRLMEGLSDDMAFMLSGGLNADNVAAAVRLTRATAVDVSSGVECRPGVKDPEKIAAFLAAAKGA